MEQVQAKGNSQSQIEREGAPLRPSVALIVTCALVLLTGIVIVQRSQLQHIRESLRHSNTKYRELSANYAATQKSQQRTTFDTPAFTMPQASEPLAAAKAAPRVSQEPSKATGDQGPYIPKDGLQFSGFSSPESAFQSFEWAVINGDYTNWLAALSPTLQEQEATNASSIKEFETRKPYASLTKGIQILDRKLIASDNVELKVRVDSENAMVILIIPMVATGGEWKLGGDIEGYTEDWDCPAPQTQ